ncbi:hypothetical protein Tco_1062731 [Tanacetum coccineum]
MAESSSPDITPKEEHVTLDRPESPNLFLLLLRLSSPLMKSLSQAFTRATNQYKEYLSEFWYTEKVIPDSKIWVSTPTGEVRGEIGITTFRNAFRAQYLLHSSMYVPPPSITTVEVADGSDHSVLRFISLLLEQMAPKYDNEELIINPTQAICNLDVPMDSRAPKYSSLTEESTNEASKSQSGHLKKETKSSSAMDTSPSHPLPPTLVVGEMHKEAHQAAGGPTSLGDTSEDGAHPQLSSGHNASADFTGSNPSVLLEDLLDILKDTRSAFFTPDSPTDEPIIVSDVSEEEENAKNNKDTKDTSVPPPSLKSAQIQELMAQVHLLQSQKEELEQAKPELSKLLASCDFASCLPTKLKELPSKVTELSEEIKKLKQHVKDMELELPGDLEEIPSKLETFTSTISSLSSQVTELKNIQWELLAELLGLPHLVSSVQEKLETLDCLPCLLKKVTNTLNKFATLVENASGTTSTGVPSADKATTSPAEGEKDADINLKNELVDLLGIDVVTQYYNKKLLYEKYCEKMKKKR